MGTGLSSKLYLNIRLCRYVGSERDEKSDDTDHSVKKKPTMSSHTPDDQMVVNLTGLLQNANTMRRNRPYREDILGAHAFA